MTRSCADLHNAPNPMFSTQARCAAVVCVVFGRLSSDSAVGYGTQAQATGHLLKTKSTPPTRQSTPCSPGPLYLAFAHLALCKWKKRTPRKSQEEGIDHRARGRLTVTARIYAKDTLTAAGVTRRKARRWAVAARSRRYWPRAKDVLQSRRR